MQTSAEASPAIILVDDEEEILLSYSVMLRRAGFSNILTVSDSRRLLPLLEGHEAGVVVLDLQMPHRCGIELLEDLAGSHPQVPALVVTAANDIETAVECMKLGALDFMLKPIDVKRFVSSVTRALELSALRREVASLRSSFLAGKGLRSGFAAIQTREPRMQAIFAYLEGIAGTDQPVLITGETGVGKELLARGIHEQSGRKGEFVPVNLAGLDELMFSDTLFGHHRAAFTGADQKREGMVARAARGTLFLDEIGDLSPPSQVKLLRFLQDGEYYPLGSDAPQRSTARIVAATNRNLQEMMAEGLFRRDLYYRLCVHEVMLPPLRERGADLPLLLEMLLREAAESLGKPVPAYAPAVIDYLRLYHFPGNIRELRAMVHKAMGHHGGGILGVQPFREMMGRNGAAAPSPSAGSSWFNPGGVFPTLKEADEFLVSEALRRSGGNQGAAASLLGITRQAINKRISKK